MTEAQMLERQNLMQMLTSFLNGEWDLKTLYDRFYMHFVEDLGPESLSDEDFDFFGEVQEKLDFVHEAPDPISRADGWISTSEYRSWLQQRLAERGV